MESFLADIGLAALLVVLINISQTLDKIEQHMAKAIDETSA